MEQKEFLEVQQRLEEEKTDKNWKTHGKITLL